MLSNAIKKYSWWVVTFVCVFAAIIVRGRKQPEMSTPSLIAKIKHQEEIDPKTAKELDRLKKSSSKDASPYYGALSKALLQVGEAKKAEEFYKDFLKGMPSLDPLYISYSSATFLIREKKLEEAQALSENLQKRILSLQAASQSNYSTLLLANTFRISLLAQQLNSRETELQSLQFLKKMLNAPESTGLNLNKQLVSQAQERMKRGEVSLEQYIAFREKILTSEPS